jgi:hypothetical protein
MSQALRTTRAAHRTLIRCLVCGCTEVRTDYVLDLGWIFLAECPRCDHRWTRSGEPPARAIRVRPSESALREVPSAA